MIKSQSGKDRKKAPKWMLAAIGLTAALIVGLSAYLLLRPIKDGNGDRLSGHLQYTVESGMAAITKYTGKDAHISIPSRIDGRVVGIIGYEAFKDCGNLISVAIPDSVAVIGHAAFAGCKSLSSVTIPGRLETIGGDAFLNCSGLTEVIIPYGVETIGASAFEGCTSLTSVAIPDSVESIGNFAFLNCRNLTEITVPGSVKTMGIGVLIGCRKLESARFEGDKPELINPFYKIFYDNAPGLTIHYRRGALDWTATWDDYPTEPY